MIGPSQQQQNKAHDDRQQKMEENMLKEAELADRLLPWNAEQKLASVINPVKIPMIIIVCVLGCKLENLFNESTTEQWHSTFARSGPMCFVHHLNRDIYNVSFRVPQWMRNITEKIDDNSVEFINEQILEIEEDSCGISKDVDGQCVVGEKVENGGLKHHVRLEHATAGLNQGKIPFVYYSLVWAVYKLVFIPAVNWPDRLMRRITGVPTAQPVLKLLMMPYNRMLGREWTLSKMGAVIRYSMLPNVLITPLITMSYDPDCRGFFHYTMDSVFSQAIYYFCVVDLLIGTTLFILGYTYYEGKIIDKWFYTAYKCWWWAVLFPLILLSMFDAFLVFDHRKWLGWKLVLKITLSIKFTVESATTFCELCSMVVTTLDITQFVIMIMTLLCPKCAHKIPILRDWVKEDEEVADVERWEKEGLRAQEIEEE